jgi:phosphohistidine swiveling domain-containing protein
MSSLPEFFSHVRLLATRPETVQRDEVIGIGLAAYGARIVSVPDHQDQRVIYVESGDMDRVYQLILEQLLSPQGWQAHLQAYQELLRAFEETVSLSLGIKDHDVQAAARAYRAWLGSLQRFGQFILAPFIVERDVDPRCQQLAERVYGADEARRVMDRISCPSELHAFQHMRLAILECVIEGRVSLVSAQTLADAFGWYNEYTFVEHLLEAEYFLKEMQALSVTDAQQERDKLLGDVEEHKRAFADFMQECPDAELRHLADVVHTYTFLRTDRVDKMKLTQVPVRRIFEACAHVFQERTHVTWTLEMVAACLTQELVDFFDKGIVPDAIQVGERLSQPWVYYREQAGAHLLGGEEMVKEVQGLIAAGFQQRQSIKGRTAFPGKVTGRVCLVRGKADLPRVQLGDVLVAKTTMPDYTPAMKLAAAFVTEEGGITSHAAIISREWKKPCVVGTGNCTKLLQDGDVVEVDAEQGIVRKI